MEKFKIRNKIWIESDMFYSSAFKTLSASALRTLMRCIQKRKWDEVKRGKQKQRVYSNDGFIFPYKEAQDLGIGTTQHWKNINKLIEIGFLDVVHQGGWYQKKEREKDYSVYKYSERWRRYGTPEFQKVEKEKALPKHFHIRENIERKKLKLTSQKRSGQLHKSEDDRLKTVKARLHESEDDRMNKETPEAFTHIA